MKLDKNTKHEVEMGDRLKFSDDCICAVVNVIRWADGRHVNAVSYTLRDLRDGRTIYSMPSSQCYGATIIKRNEEV